MAAAEASATEPAAAEYYAAAESEERIRRAPVSKTITVRIAVRAVGIGIRIAAVCVGAVRSVHGTSRLLLRVRVLILAVIRLDDRLEGDRALRRGKCERRFQAEGQGRFGGKNRGASAGDEHADDTGGRADARADCRASATFGSAADEGAESGGNDQGCCVASIGIAAGILDERSADGKNLAVNESDFSDLHGELRRAADVPGLLGGGDAAGEKLPGTRDNPAIGNERLNERCGEAVALLVLFAGKSVIDLDANERAGRKSE